MLIAWRFPAARVIGIEAQDVSVELARRSLAWTGIDDRCEVVHGDLREIAPDGTFDLVTGTPPYFERGRGVESDRVQRAPCRFEHRGGIEEYAAVAARRLAPGAPFVACETAGERARVAAAAAAAGLAIERWRDVIPREGKAPLFSTFVLRRLGEAARCIEHPALVVRDRHGRWTAPFIDVRHEMGMPA
jgi:tRNA1(Val) A37 N6-methylase TrmN6